MNYGTTKTAADATSVQAYYDASSSSSSSSILSTCGTPASRRPGGADPEAEGGRSAEPPPRDEEGGDEQRWQTRAWTGLRAFYRRNIGLFFVFLAQTFGSVMSTAAKLLTSGEENQFHALQIIFVRMLATAVLGFLYMWHQQVPDFPFGKRGIRGLLVLRGLAGFAGLFGSYYSLTYLDLADATVISFLVPTLTAFVCYVWLREEYTGKEALAGLIALSGVLLVARPPFLFPHEAADPKPEHGESYAAQHAVAVISLVTTDRPPRGLVPEPPASPSLRGFAVLCAVLGTFAAAVAYTTIRVIGKRAHSLISVNYFALVATVGSAVIILVHPDLHFVLPHGGVQWTLLAIIGIAGFLLQFLLTEGLKREKAGRATNMTYLQMVFALAIERVVWGTTPPPVSLLGAVLIIGAAVWLSLQKNHSPVREEQQKTKKKSAVVDEESSLLGSQGDGELRN